MTTDVTPGDPPETATEPTTDAPARDGADPAAGIRPIGASGTFRIAALVLGTICLLWRFWIVSRWSWYQDDWVYLHDAHAMPLADYVFQNYNRHLMPGQFLIAKLLMSIAPMQYGGALTFTILCSAASYMAWILGLREIFGERKRLIYPLALLSLSPLFMPISLWWAAALQVFPLQLFLGLSIYVSARYSLRGRQRRDLWLVFAVLALALFFWEKALLVTVPVVAVALMLSAGSLRARLSSLWKLFLGLFIEVLVYLPFYLHFTRTPDTVNTKLFESRSVTDSLNFFFTGIVDLLGPFLFGGPWSGLSDPQQRYAQSPGTSTFFFLALIAALITIFLKHRPQAWIPVSMVSIYAIVSWGLVFTSSRYDGFGLQSVRQPHYAADLVVMLLLGVALLITPTRLEPAESLNFTSMLHFRGRHLRQTVVGLAAFSLGCTLVFTNGQVWDSILPQSPKAWADRMLNQIPKARELPIYDSTAPKEAIWVFFFFQGHLSYLFAPIDPGVRWNADAPAINVVNSQGVLTVMGRPTSTEAVSPGPNPGCGYLVEADKETAIPITNSLYKWQWGLQLEYFSGGESQATLRTDSAVKDIPITRGLNRYQMIVGDSLHEVRIKGAPGSQTFCVTAVAAGNVEPSDEKVTLKGTP